MQDLNSEAQIFYIEVYARIEIQCSSFPDGKVGADLANKIRTKVFCNRENMSLVELKVNEYEGAINRDEED